MLFREGIKEALKLERDLYVIGEAADGEETLKQVQGKNPDILLLDINMPKLNGLEVMRHLMMSHNNCKIILLTTNYDETYMLKMIKSGVTSYLLKDVKPNMLVAAIRTVYHGNSFIYPSIAKIQFGKMKYQHDKQQNEIINIYDYHKERR